jgi:hypothetical protein
VETTQPMTLDQAVEAAIAPEQPAEEVVEEVTDSQPDVEETEEPEEEQPVADSDDEGEEVDEDDGESEAETDDESEADDDEDIEDDVEDDEDEEPEETLYTVKVDGAEEKVTLEDLKRGYSGQKYVQKGMQEAAEQRKQAEQVYMTLLQERQNAIDLYNQIRSGNLNPPVAPRREDYVNDDYGYMVAQSQYNDSLVEYQQKEQVIVQQMQQQSEAERRAREEYATQEALKLRDLVPELADPKKLDSFQKSLVEGAKYYGYTPEEIAGIVSHRDMLVLRDAMKYRQLQQKGDIVREKSKKARKPVKAGAKKVQTKSQAERKQRDKLRRSGSIDDALALMLNPNQ